MPQFNVNLGEKPFDVIERICRYTSTLAYDVADGAITLGPVNAGAVASGFAEGKNIESARSVEGKRRLIDAFLSVD